MENLDGDDGHPTTWFVQNPPKVYICTICTEVMKNPHSSKCEHCFCKVCINKNLSHGNRLCPLCNAEVESLKTERWCNTAINLLTVRCNADPNSIVNVDCCDWTGALEDHKQHLLTCPFSLTDCPLFSISCCSAECSGKVRADQLNLHISAESTKNNNKLVHSLIERMVAAEKHTLHNNSVCLDEEGDLYMGERDPLGGKTGYGTNKSLERHEDRDPDDHWVVYSGRFVDNLRDGYGIDENNSGTYCGEFKKDKMCGFGFKRFHGGGMYYGMFENSMYHGHGVQKYKDNVSQFEGTWKKGEIVRGKMIQKVEGGVEIYEGPFRRGLYHGLGKLTLPDQTVQEGIFEEGHFYGKPGKSSSSKSSGVHKKDSHKDSSIEKNASNSDRMVGGKASSSGNNETNKVGRPRKK